MMEYTYIFFFRILEHYPSKWPGADDVEDSESTQKEMFQRYGTLEAIL